MTRPNLILIVMDTARADAFEPYGAGAGSTPAVAQLASRGAALPAVFAPASWTVPSHASMFTGRLPRALGLAQAPNGTPQSCRPILESLRDLMLPEVLRRAGYATLGLSTNIWVTDHSGFSTGFDEFDYISTGRNHRMHDPSLRRRVGWDLEGVRAKVDDGAGEAERLLLRRLESGPAQPFFWFVNLSECHSPYLPPRPYNDLPLWQRLRAAEDARRHLTLAAIWQACLGQFDVDDGAIGRMRHLYRRAIRGMDDWVARLLTELDERGLLDDTIVVVTSDHGENLGEGGLMGHAFSLDDRLIRVPFVVSTRDGFARASVTSLVELPQMVADALQLTEHPWSGSTEADGIAVAQLDGLASPTDNRVPDIARQWKLDEAAVRRLTTSMTCATDGRFKLLRQGDEELLYDLASDPLEERPGPRAVSSSDLDSTVAHLRAAIESADDDLDADDLVGHRLGSPPVPQDEDAEIADKMRLLGYL